MTGAEVTRQRMRRMGLARPVAADPLGVVRSHLAMQAQDFGPAKWSIGQRLETSADADVEREISSGSILRTHVLRPTWHLVARTDLRWLLSLTAPRIQRGLEPRHRRLGLDPETRSRAERCIADQLRSGNHLTRGELGDALRAFGIDTEGQRLPHLLMHCELESIICSGSLRGRHQTYALFDERVPAGPRFDREEAVVELVRRYLAAHGPASLRDLGWWSGLTIQELRRGLEGLGGAARRRELDGVVLWSVGEAPRGGARRDRVHLLQAYDELVVGYTESRYIGDPRADRVRAAFKDRRMPTGTVMLGARVTGHWRRVTTDKVLGVEVLLYEELSGPDADALAHAADALGRFVGKEPRLSVGVI